MEQVLLLSITITLLFFIMKIVEMKYLDKEIKPFKVILRDTVMVFFSSALSAFVYFHFTKHIHDFFNIITNTPMAGTPANTPVFTDEPAF